MSVSIEKIEELRKRASIGYEEAKILLEKHNGDMVEVMIELEKNKKVYSHGHYEYCKGTFLNKLKKLFKKGQATKFVITKKGEIIVNIPINYLIVAFIMGLHLMVLSLILIFITGCKMSIKRAEGAEYDIDDVIVDVSNKVKNAAKNLTGDECCGSKKVNIKKNDDGSYNEHTVE